MINTKFKYKIKEVSRKHNLPESIVEEIFNSQFKFFRTTIENTPIKDITLEEEFDKLKTTFYFKYIGKFYTNWSKIEHIKKATILKNNKLKDNGED